MPKKYIIIISAALAAIIIGVCFAVALGGQESPNADLQAGKSAQEPFCLLVLGKDKVSRLTDVMMLVAFDTSRDRICVMQIPRDTYAYYGSSAHKKLNTATKILGGEEELCEFLSGALGIGIDGYLSLELEGFRKAIDAIGGVEIDIPVALDYEDPEQNLYIHLPAGKQILDGKKAEMLVRFRDGYARGDLDRLDMQKRFLAALFAKLKTEITAANAYKLATSVFPHVRTNVSLPMAVALGLEAIKVDNSELAFLTLPGEDVVSDKSGASYYVMSLAPTEAVLREYFSMNDIRVDEKSLFKHPTNQKFSDIYYKDFEYSVVFADKLG